MEPSSHPSCTNPFPFYELHQVAHNTMETATPSAMDILCEIVNSEYSDIGYAIAPPVVSIPSHESANHQHTEKESFLDILYSTGSKAMDIVDNDVEMIHEQHPPYSIRFNRAPSMSNSTAAHVFSPPDMHHFKLPHLEQEPEASITSSQVDDSFKHKEIRRNLERSLLMQEFGGVSAAVCPSKLQALGTCMFSSGGEGKLAGKHESSACSNPLMFCEGYEYMDSPLTMDKVSSSNTVRHNYSGADDENKSNMLESHVKLSKRKAASCTTEGVSSLKKSATSSGNNNIARMKHGVGTATGSEKSGLQHANNNGGEETKGVMQEYMNVEESSAAARSTKRLQLELGRCDNMARGDSLLAKAGQRKPLVERSLERNGQLKSGTAVGAAARVDGQLAGSATGKRDADGVAASELQPAISAVDAGRPNLTHISVERNRRKQMNEHLAILRSLMPNSYVQRSDQASIIGGVVEFIKELQQLLTSLETQKRRRAYVAEALSPRVSIASGGPSPRGASCINNLSQLSPRSAAQELVATSRSPLADVEVKLAGGAHVLLRTLSHKATRGQLIHLIAALECMSLQILHLNITTLQQAVLYTFTLKIGIECRLSVDELADVGQQIFKDIHARRL